MKKSKFLFFALFIICFTSNSQSIFGKWKTVDDETRIEKSIVEIYQENGKAFAKIIELLEKDKKDKLCEKCSGIQKNKPIKGMMIINGLSKNENEWNNGKILDPKTGKEYKCYISLEEPNKLKVRGYLGFSFIGRTQYWYKINE